MGNRYETAGGFISRVSAYLSADLSIPTLTAVKIPFNGEQFDDNNEYDAVTNHRFTAKVAGYYLVLVAVIWNASAGGYVYEINITLNGATYLNAVKHSSAANMLSQEIATFMHLIVNDYLESQGYHNYTANQIIQGHYYTTVFNVVRVA